MDTTHLSLIFSPSFPACPHKDMGTGIQSIEADPNLAGSIRVFHPAGRTRLEIGRHSDCWIRIGARMDAYDTIGNSKFNTISRVCVTFAWSDAAYLSRPQWLVMTGGVFVDSKGERVSITDPPIGVWLNGEKLQPEDTNPLFAPGTDMAKISIGHMGRIVILERALGEHSTSWPASTWQGGSENGWPDAEHQPDGGTAGHKRAEIEQAILENKATPTTWQSELIRQLNATPVQRVLIYAVIALCVIALILLIGGR